MKYFFLQLALSLGLFIAAQDPKGLIALGNADSTTGTSRALVIGISKYQQIPSLQYADKDAEEFSLFLLHNNVWNIDRENVILLTNEKAKAGDILASLSWLIDSSKSGDRVVFYFSGHGDVETSFDNSQGFLLAYDSPRNNYITGAISINILQKAFSAMIAKGVKLLLVTDACRAGHLAGGVGGVEQTAKAFSQQWKSETKVLSAQPDELSYEGKDWGGGRGVFSFFLVKGLSGYADINGDSLVTLSELEQYVGLQVAQETKFKQQPIFEGPGKFSYKIAGLDSLSMNRYAQWKSGSEIAVVMIREKNEVNKKGVADTDSTNNCPAYNQLLLLLENDNLDLVSWKNALQLYDSVFLCSNPIYRQKSRYKLSAALMNDIQQTVNQTLIGQKLIGEAGLNDALLKIELINKINKETEMIYSDHLINIKRYIIIDKLSHLDKKERQRYMEEQNLAASLDSAMALEPTAAYLVNAKGVLFLYTQKDREDSALSYFKKAMQLSPTWLIPRLLTGYAYESMGKIDSAIFWYNEILRMDTIFQQFECAICFYEELADLYYEIENYPLAEIIYKKALEADPANVRCLYGLLYVYSAVGKRNELIPLLRRIEIYDSTSRSKLETLQAIIVNKILGKKNVEQRLQTISDSLTEKDRGIYIYTRGLFKEYYNIGSPVKNYRNAVDWVKGVDPNDEKTYRMKLIKSRISYGDVFYLGDYIDFTEETLGSYLTTGEKADLSFYKALYLLITDPQSEKEHKIDPEIFYTDTGKKIEDSPDKFNLVKRQEAGITILKNLISKALITCKDIKYTDYLIKFRKVELVNKLEFDLILKACDQ